MDPVIVVSASTPEAAPPEAEQAAAEAAEVAEVAADIGAEIAAASADVTAQVAAEVGAQVAAEAVTDALITQQAATEAAETERAQWDVLTELMQRVQAIQADLAILVDQNLGATGPSEAGDELTIEAPPEAEETPARTWGVTRAGRKTWRIF